RADHRHSRAGWAGRRSREWRVPDVPLSFHAFRSSALTPPRWVCGIILSHGFAQHISPTGCIMRRLAYWLIVIGLVIGGISLASYPAMSWWRERSAPKYLTSTVSRGRVETVVNSTGTIKPVRTVSVGAFTSGPIKEVLVDFNTEITQKEQII